MDFILVVTQSRYFLVDFDPIAFSVGPLDVHWYGIMYLLAFLFFWAGGNWVARKRPWLGWKPQEVGDMLFYGMLGVVVGGRLGYVLFYGLAVYFGYRYAFRQLTADDFNRALGRAM